MKNDLELLDKYFSVPIYIFLVDYIIGDDTRVELFYDMQQIINSINDNVEIEDCIYHYEQLKYLQDIYDDGPGLKEMEFIQEELDSFYRGYWAEIMCSQLYHGGKNARIYSYDEYKAMTAQNKAKINKTKLKNNLTNQLQNDVTFLCIFSAQSGITDMNKFHDSINVLVEDIMSDIDDIVTTKYYLKSTIKVDDLYLKLDLILSIYNDIIKEKKGLSIIDYI